MVLTSIPPAVITAFLTTLTTILDPTIVGENALNEVSPGVGELVKELSKRSAATPLAITGSSIFSHRHATRTRSKPRTTYFMSQADEDSYNRRRCLDTEICIQDMRVLDAFANENLSMRKAKSELSNQIAGMAGQCEQRVGKVRDDYEDKISNIRDDCMNGIHELHHAVSQNVSGTLRQFFGNETKLETKRKNYFHILESCHQNITNLRDKHDKDIQRYNDLKTEHDVFRARCSNEMTNYENICNNEKLECSNKLLKQSQQKEKDKKNEKWQEKYSSLKVKHNECKDRRDLLEEANSGLSNTYQNCSLYYNVQHEHFKRVNESLDSMRNLNKQCMVSLNACQDDYKGRTDAVTNNVMLSAGKDEMQKKLDNVTELYHECLETSNEKLSNKSKCQADLIACNNHKFNLTDFIQRNLTKSQLKKIRLDQCEKNFAFFNTRLNELGADKQLLHEEVDELRKNRNLTLNLWNNTKQELRIASTAVTLLKEEVQILTNEKLTIHTSLQRIIDEQNLTKNELDQIKIEHDKLKEKMRHMTSKHTACTTELSSCQTGYEEVMNISRTHQIDGIKCHNAVARIYHKLNNCGSHQAFERCKKRLRAVNSKAYTILDKCNECFLENIYGKKKRTTTTMSGLVQPRKHQSSTISPIENMSSTKKTPQSQETIKVEPTEKETNSGANTTSKGLKETSSNENTSGNTSTGKSGQNGAGSKMSGGSLAESKRKNPWESYNKYDELQSDPNSPMEASPTYDPDTADSQALI